MKGHKSVIPEGMPSIGVPGLDDQHLEIDALCGDLERALVIRARPGVLMSKYEWLAIALKHHFAEEEVLLDRLPDTLNRAHREEHRRLTGMIDQLRDGLERGDREKWLWRHHVFVGEMAQHYARFDRPLGDVIRSW